MAAPLLNPSPFPSGFGKVGGSFAAAFGAVTAVLFDGAGGGGRGGVSERAGDAGVSGVSFDSVTSVLAAKTVVRSSLRPVALLSAKIRK